MRAECERASKLEKEIDTWVDRVMGLIEVDKLIEEGSHRSMD